MWSYTVFIYGSANPCDMGKYVVLLNYLVEMKDTKKVVQAHTCCYSGGSNFTRLWGNC